MQGHHLSTGTVLFYFKLNKLNQIPSVNWVFFLNPVMYRRVFIH